MRQKLFVSIVTGVLLSSVPVAAVPFTIHTIGHDTEGSIFEEFTPRMSWISSGWPQIFDGGAEDGSMGGKNGSNGLPRELILNQNISGSIVHPWENLSRAGP